MITRRKVGGGTEKVHPAFIYSAPSPTGWSTDQISAQMSESIRDTLEEIRDSQMLQCEVADAIKSMAREIRGLRRDLKKQRGGKP